MWLLAALQQLAVAVDVAGLGGVGEPRALVGVEPGIRVQALRHLVADHVHQPLEHSLQQARQHYAPHLCSLQFMHMGETNKKLDSANLGNARQKWICTVLSF